jgi:hypothetical protein
MKAFVMSPDDLFTSEPLMIDMKNIFMSGIKRARA